MESCWCEWWQCWAPIRALPHVAAAMRTLTSSTQPKVMHEAPSCASRGAGRAASHSRPACARCTVPCCWSAGAETCSSELNFRPILQWLAALMQGSAGLTSAFEGRFPEKRA